jgi:hypothetical protein
MAGLRHRRDREWRRFDGDKKLQRRRAFRILILSHRGTVRVRVRCAVRSGSVSAQVRMNPSRAVVPVVAVVVEVRVHQRRTQGCQWQSDG